jgi:hypothetical protein
MSTDTAPVLLVFLASFLTTQGGNKSVTFVTPPPFLCTRSIVLCFSVRRRHFSRSTFQALECSGAPHGAPVRWRLSDGSKVPMQPNSPPSLLLVTHLTGVHVESCCVRVYSSATRVLSMATSFDGCPFAISFNYILLVPKQPGSPGRVQVHLPSAVPRQGKAPNLAGVRPPSPRGAPAASSSFHCLACSPRVFNRSLAA